MISFDMNTAVSVISDDEIEDIKRRARNAADRGVPLPPFKLLPGTTQVQRMLAALRHVVWCDAHDERTAERIKKAAK